MLAIKTVREDSQAQWLDPSFSVWVLSIGVEFPVQLVVELTEIKVTTTKRCCLLGIEEAGVDSRSAPGLLS